MIKHGEQRDDYEDIAAMEDMDVDESDEKDVAPMETMTAQLTREASKKRAEESGNENKAKDGKLTEHGAGDESVEKKEKDAEKEGESHDRGKDDGYEQQHNDRPDVVLGAAVRNIQLAEEKIEGEEGEDTQKTNGMDEQAWSEERVEAMRAKIDERLSSTEPMDMVEAAETWRQLEFVTDHLAHDLCEQLRLVLEASVATGLQGDFRSGKRLNMRKIIPYIASNFRKDKIWLRRTKPCKRDYQVAVAIDDSRSMQLYHSRQMALEALCVLCTALTRLEVGQLAVLGFGEGARLLHPFEAAFSSAAGPAIIRQFSFAQDKTHVGQLLESATSLLATAASARSTASTVVVNQLLFIISDSDNLYQEGQAYVERWCRAVHDQGVFVVFVVIDSPQKKHSVLDQKKVVFKNNRPITESYMDRFADKNYIILRYYDEKNIFCEFFLLRNILSLVH